MLTNVLYYNISGSEAGYLVKLAILNNIICKPKLSNKHVCMYIYNLLSISDKMWPLKVSGALDVDNINASQQIFYSSYRVFYLKIAVLSA